MDAAATVELGWLQEPQVEAGEVTERHGIPEEILFQYSLLLIKSFLLFFDMLLDQSSTVIIEMLKDKCFFIWI